MDCQKGKKEKKSTGTWDVFLMLQTLWGLGCDNKSDSKNVVPLIYTKLSISLFFFFFNDNTYYTKGKCKQCL